MYAGKMRTFPTNGRRKVARSSVVAASTRAEKSTVGMVGTHVNRMASGALVAVMSTAAALTVGLAGLSLGSGPAFGMPAQVGAGGHALATTTPTATATVAPKPACPSTVPHPITPKRLFMQHVTAARGAPVIAPPRVHGVPGVPPLTNFGKHAVAWDRAQRVKPGSTQGNVLMNAHVWPDGSAIGNKMLAKLHKGDRMVVFGKAHKLCYRVTDRVQVKPRQGLRRYYSQIGSPKLAIVVCSGRRIAPGVWTMRTIWYARPSS